MATVVAAAVLGGCSTVEAYRACGTAGCPGDSAISTTVRSLFDQHPALEPPNLIDIQTIDRVVYLYGLVDTDMQKQLAEAVALRAPGVVRVVDSIGLRDGTF